MKILIVPTIREIYKNQIEVSVDLKLIELMKKIFKNAIIDIYNFTIKKNYDLILLAGGNNSFINNNVDKVRNKINNVVYKFALKKKIKVIGICHGAHFLSKKFGFIIARKKNHVGSHKIIINLNKTKSHKTVNSYHNETIKFTKIKNVNVFAIAEDNTVEAFHIKNRKILGIVWHPERYKKIKNFDKKLIKEFYATNRIVCR